MERIKITGGRVLEGRIRPAAAKNSVLPLLAASLLCSRPCVLRGVPRLSDVDASLALLRAVGAGPVRRGPDILLPPAAVSGHVPPELAGAMRGSVFYLAPLLVRAGTVELPLPGGCRLGPRPIDIHLAGLGAMGAEISESESAVTLRRQGSLHGVDFTLRLPSVGATLTLLMAAACARGETVLRGAACEPEIADTAAFLRMAGAQIEGAGTPVIRVRGAAGPLPGGGVHLPLPDRIAAATYAAAVAVAGGRIAVEHCRPGHLAPFLRFLRTAGCEITAGPDGFTAARDPDIPLWGGADLCTGAWPGFATDTAPLAAAVLLCARGESHIHDALFQNRFACAEGFAAMGALVRADGRDLWIGGDAQLHAACVTAPDLRGGAALVLAALAAGGTGTVMDSGHIRRGYQDLPAELATLGAHCTYVKTMSDATMKTASAMQMR